VGLLGGVFPSPGIFGLWVAGTGGGVALGTESCFVALCGRVDRGGGAGGLSLGGTTGS